MQYLSVKYSRRISPVLDKQTHALRLVYTKRQSVTRPEWEDWVNWKTTMAMSSYQYEGNRFTEPEFANSFGLWPIVGLSTNEVKLN